MGNSATKLPYNPGTKRVTGYKHYDGIWQVFVGDDGQTLIFRHDKKGAKPQDTACAQNALKRLRSLRPPYILKLLVRALCTSTRLCASCLALQPSLLSWKFLTPPTPSFSSHLQCNGARCPALPMHTHTPWRAASKSLAR